MDGIQPATSVNQGADAVLNLLSRQDELIGRQVYFDGLSEARAHAQAYDAVARKTLRDLSFSLSGLPNHGTHPA